MNNLVSNPSKRMQTHAHKAAQLMRQLSNENRLLVCCHLGERELSVGQLNEQIPMLSQSALSQHLAKLREAGLVATRKQGQSIYYRLTGNAVPRIINVLQSIYCPEISQ